MGTPVATRTSAFAHAASRVIRVRVPLGTVHHAEYLGVMRHIIERGIPDEGLGLVDWVRALYVEYWLNNVIVNYGAAHGLTEIERTASKQIIDG